MTVQIASRLYDQLIALAAADPDHEVCGLLWGSADRIDDIEPAANVADDRSVAFELDPQRLIDAMRTARQGGPAVIGHFHSHPRGPAEPSQRDAACAAADGQLWLIIAGGAVTAWRAVEHGAHKNRFDPVAILRC